MDEQTSKPRPVGWRRVGAFVIDSIVLGLLGVVPGFVVFDTMARMGEWARLIGLVIAVGYFGILTSRIGGGRTLGHRALQLKVVRRDGQPPEIGVALVRAAILSAPFVLNGIQLNGTQGHVLPLVVVVVAGALIFGLGLAQIYLLLFNGPERRLAHDLLTGTSVARADSTAPLGAVRVVPARVAAAIVVVALALFAGVAIYSQANTTLLAVSRDRLARVERLPEVMSATVGETTTATTAATGRAVARNLVVAARLNRWPKDSNAEMRRLAQTALAAGPLKPGQQLVVSFSYGFSIGFGGGGKSYGGSMDPLTLLQR